MDTTSLEKKSTALNIILWIMQFVLAGMFLMAGYTKLATPIDKLATMIVWTKDVPLPLVRFIATCEILGALGLLLPSIFKVKPILTPLAATGLALIMLFATIFHISRGEFQNIKITIALCLLAIIIAWGRFSKAPIYSE